MLHLCYVILCYGLLFVAPPRLVGYEADFMMEASLDSKGTEEGEGYVWSSIGRAEKEPRSQPHQKQRARRGKGKRNRTREKGMK
jgi:hypothetical protein